jgi:hypothetical protein
VGHHLNNLIAWLNLQIAQIPSKQNQTMIATPGHAYESTRELTRDLPGLPAEGRLVLASKTLHDRRALVDISHLSLGLAFSVIINEPILVRLYETLTAFSGASCPCSYAGFPGCFLAAYQVMTSNTNWGIHILDRGEGLVDELMTEYQSDKGILMTEYQSEDLSRDVIVDSFGRTGQARCSILNSRHLG